MQIGKLQVSQNGRYLVRENGDPFFWIGDTAWELFHRLNRTEADLYLQNRAAKGFNVIQAVALAPLNGIDSPNANGDLPLIENDPLCPNESYWEHVDYIVTKANALGLVIGFLPCWGSYWKETECSLFTPESAELYGKWLGSRYRDAGLVWILGGDRICETERERTIIRRMAEGLSRGDGLRHLRTFHPAGARGSAEVFHSEAWLDFNMRQNGHGTWFSSSYDQMQIDYARRPAKPLLDGESTYEGIPIAFNSKRFGHSIAADARRALYWDIFCGAFGHTYGHNSIWQMWTPEREGSCEPIMPWQEALDAPGAYHIPMVRHLFKSRPFLKRIPDDSVLVSGGAVPGSGACHFRAIRDEDGTYAMVYAPAGLPFQVRMDVIQSKEAVAWWFNPRTGQGKVIGTYPSGGLRSFHPPDAGEMLDQVLVMDDPGLGYPIPAPL